MMQTNRCKTRYIISEKDEGERSEFTGCTPTKESSQRHPAYVCCRHIEAKEVQQKQ